MVGKGKDCLYGSPARSVYSGFCDNRATLASKKVSPKGPGSGMKMLTFFINRAGKSLSGARRAKLERAKKLLSERIEAARGTKTRKAHKNP